MPVFLEKDFSDFEAPGLVYVRQILAREILGDMEDSDIDLAPDQILYALHDSEGERLAVMLDREEAFKAAEANDMAPVFVH